MKIAILSNIKSNIYALQEVLLDITKNKVDAVLNLGDSFYGPIAPKETYDLIRESSFINICGNEDRKILEASLEQLEQDKLLKYIYNDLGEEVLYWIQNLPFEKLIGEDFYMIHGTYFDDSDSLLKDSEKVDENKIIELLDDIKSKFIFCANSNIARCETLNSGQVIITPGAVGMNENEIVKEASYAILTIQESEFKVELLRVSYDYEKAIDEAKKAF